MDRSTYLLIDGGYLFKGSLRLRGAGMLDYQLLCKYLAEQVGLGQNPDGSEHPPFFLYVVVVVAVDNELVWCCLYYACGKQALT